MLSHLTPNTSKTPGYATAVNSNFIFLRGSKCSLSPLQWHPSPTRKYLGPLCPSCPYILGTSLKSARFLYSRRRWGKCPLLPPHHRRPCPTRKFLGPLCPASPKILGTPLKSARFHIPEGVGASAPCPPPGRPCPHQKMPWSLVPL